MKKLLLIASIAVFVLVGCASKQTALPAKVDDAVLRAATALVDSADSAVTAINSGDPTMTAKLDTFDARLEGFGKGDGPEQMPKFNASLVKWRNGIDVASKSSSGVMQDRAIKDMAKSLDTARTELDAALTAAGK